MNDLQVSWRAEQMSFCRLNAFMFWHMLVNSPKESRAETMKKTKQAKIENN